MNNDHLQPLLERGAKAPETARTLFGHLSKKQLNWKPGPKQWSIAECLDHLIVTNKRYFPIIEQALSAKTNRSTFWQKMPVLPKMWGNFIKKAVNPETPRKVKTFKPFEPAKSEYEVAVLDEFETVVNKTIEMLKTTGGFDHQKMHVTSPVAKFITYPFIDVCHILVWHTERHLQQGKIVIETDGFPK